MDRIEEHDREEITRHPKISIRPISKSKINRFEKRGGEKL